MKTIKLIALLLFIYSSGMAQVHQNIIRDNPDLSFDELVQLVEAYYEDKDKGRGSGYKQYQRWKFFNETRLDENGNIHNVPRRLLEEYMSHRNNEDASRTPSNLNYNCEWEAVGGHAYSRVVSGHNGGLGRVNAIVFDPDDMDIIYAGTPAGGLWRTTNGGGTWNPANNTSNWEPLTDGIPSCSVSGIAIDPDSPSNSRTIYILTGDGDGSDNPSMGVLKSFDGGDTWFQTGLNFDLNAAVFEFGYKLLMHPEDSDVLYAATNLGLYRTTDAGINWILILGGRITDVEFRTDDPETIYAVTPSTFFSTTNGGDDWTSTTCGITNAGVRMAIGVTPADPDMVYILSGGNILDGMNNPIPGLFNGVYRSTDGGDCFTQMSNSPNILDGSVTGNDTRQQANYDLVIAISPTDENEVHVGGINSWRSYDGGVNWTQTAYWNENVAAAGDYNHADVHAMEYRGNALYSGSDGGVYVSTNNGDDWVNLSQGLRISQFYRIAAFTDGGTDYVMAGAQDNGLNQLRDAGSGFGALEHWEGADGFGCSVDLANNIVYGAIQNGSIYRFNYPGGAFSEITFPPLDGTGAFLTPHTFDPNTATGTLHVGYADVWSTDDQGGSWNNISNGNIDNNLCRHIEVAPSDTNTIYVVKPNNLYRTTDGGSSWNDITGTIPVGVGSVLTYITIDPTDPDRIWVTLGGFVRFTVNGYNVGNKVFRSVDGGTTWVNMSEGLPNVPANCIIYENGTSDGLYVGMDVGVYYRDNSMSEWLLFSNNLPNAIVADMDINYSNNKLYVGTFGRGVLCTDLFSSCNRVCLSCPVFDEIHSLPNTYSSEDCIYSSSTVYDRTPVTYAAEEFILLQEDFHVQSYNDAIFRGVIQDCDLAPSPMALIGNKRALSGFYVGELPNQGSGKALVLSNNRTEQIKSPGKLFPNPTLGNFRLEFQVNSPGPISIVTYNSLGKRMKILEQDLQVSSGIFRNNYSIQDLPNGTYYIEVKTNEQSYVYTLIKQEHYLLNGE
jgi:photosystem II stability/assembly factor-like uncharacterized protein